MTGGQPFNMDMAMQIAQTQSFQGLVDATRANNTQMQSVADSALAANSGQMSQQFQVWLADIHQTATSNNQVLNDITDALHMGIGSTDNADASHAANFSQLTSMIQTPYSSGSHFG
jgi:uncharacterized protein YukE